MIIHAKYSQNLNARTLNVVDFFHKQNKTHLIFLKNKDYNRFIF